MTAPEGTVEIPTWAHYTEPSYVAVGDVNVAYRRKGQGAPVVFLQGPRMTRRWLPFYEALAGGADLVVPELPGFGDTPMPTWLDGLIDVVLHCDELFDTLQLGDLNLVGHGLGGWLAAEFAVFYPDRLKSLTLLSPFGLRYPGHPLRDVFRLLPDEVSEAYFTRADDDVSEFISFGDADETMIRNVEESITVARLMWNPRYDYKLDARLRRVQCPALIVGADDDHIVPREHLARWVELLPSAKLAMISGADQPTGHGFIVQEPVATADAVLSFINAASL